PSLNRLSPSSRVPTDSSCRRPRQLPAQPRRRQQPQHRRRKWGRVLRQALEHRSSPRLSTATEQEMGGRAYWSQLKRFHSALGCRFPLPRAGEGQGEGVAGQSTRQRGSLTLALSQREREKAQK